MIKIISLFLIVFTSSFLQSQDLGNLYDQFKIQSESGNNEEAEKTMLLISEKEAEIFFMLIERSNSFYEEENWDAYVELLNKSINYIGDHPSPNTEKFHAKKDSIYYYSIERLEEVFKVKNDVITLSISAIMKMELGEYNLAIEDYTLILKYDPKNPSVYYNRAMAFSEIGKIEEAIADHTYCIRLDRKYASSYLNRGFIYMEIGQYSKAIQDFKSSMKLNNIELEKAFALNNIGYCHYKLGDMDKALIFIEHSINLYPINAYAYKNLALVQITMQNIELACESILKSIDLGFVNKYGDEILEMKQTNCDK